jgi:hypothetical protein
MEYVSSEPDAMVVLGVTSDEMIDGGISGANRAAIYPEARSCY